MRQVDLTKSVKIDNKVFCNQECDMLIRLNIGEVCVLIKDAPQRLQHEGVGQTSRTNNCLELFG